LPADFSFSEWIALSYVIVYFVLGLIIGRFASQIPDAVSNLDFSMIKFSDTSHPVKQNRKRRKRRLLIGLLSILLSIELMGVFLKLSFGQFFFRVVFFMLLFYYVVGPLTTQLIKFLSRNRAQEISDLNNDVAQLRDFVKPVIKHVNLNYHGVYRFKMFVLYMVAISLNDVKSDNE
jgi:MFS family permease